MGRLIPRAVAALGVGFPPALLSRIGLRAYRRPEPPAATTGGGRLGARRKLPRRTPSRADTWLELRCTVSTSAGLSIHADAAVDAHSAIESVAGLQIAVAADVAQHAAIESTADVNDVLLEILMMA